jgi:hypothetical protein
MMGNQGIYRILMSKYSEKHPHEEFEIITLIDLMELDCEDSK